MEKQQLVKPSKLLLFRPELWQPDKNSGKKPYSSNCLSYALNKKSLGFPFWNSFANAAGKKPTCLKDFKLQVSAILPSHEIPPFNLFDTPFDARVKAAFAGMHCIDVDEAESAHLRGEHVFAFSSVYQHFFRKDSDGSWSHKLGRKEPTDCDDRGRKILRLDRAFFEVVNDCIDNPTYSSEYLYFRIPKQGVWVQASTHNPC